MIQKSRRSKRMIPQPHPSPPHIFSRLFVSVQIWTNVDARIYIPSPVAENMADYTHGLAKDAAVKLHGPRGWTTEIWSLSQFWNLEAQRQLWHSGIYQLGGNQILASSLRPLQECTNLSIHWKARDDFYILPSFLHSISYACLSPNSPLFKKTDTPVHGMPSF